VVAVALVNTEEEALRLTNMPVVLLKLSIVPDAEVRSVIVALVIVVVANVEVPRTTPLPVVVELPFTSTLKFELATQAEPFQ